jgi:hypothetical protein
MRLNEYLTALGTTSEAVAESLRKQGVKGLQRSIYKCPVLNALYKAVPNYWPGLRILGGPLNYRATLNDDQIMDPVLPKPVVAFIRDFDEGKYPDLVAEA